MENKKNKNKKPVIPISFTKATAMLILGFFIWIVVKISSQDVEFSFLLPEAGKIKVGWLLLLSFASGYIFSKLPLKLKL
ncbi:hypothetical protein CL645_03620 [bacterium]|nr:hypothetical protein [bacterium]|tara:strand:- start:369 stop:605 length:237 start_codon:yes stop_codon:yes gene_type:complete